MSKLKIMVGINTLTVLDQMVYGNHIKFFHRLGKNHPDIDFGLNTPKRASIDRMRNYTARIAVDNDFDYLMFIDDDVLLPEHIDPLQHLLDCNADIAAGWTIIRGYPFNNMFFKYTENKQLEFYNKFELNEKGLIDVDAVGFSCVLIKCSLLKKVRPPWFVTGPKNTEDVYFCVKARQDYPETSIVVDPKVWTGHILGTEIITPENREHYTDFLIACNPDIGRAERKIFSRGDEYLEMIKNPSEETARAFYEEPRRTEGS